jgi:hypothetical protein
MISRGEDLQTEGENRGLYLPGPSAKAALFIMHSLSETMEDLLPGKLCFSDYWKVAKDMALWGPIQFIKYVKYWTVWPMAHYLKQEMPRIPEGYPTGFPMLFHGGARRYLRDLVNQYRPNGRPKKTTERLVWNWLQAVKRAAAEVGPEMILSSMTDHRQKMTSTPLPDIWSTESERDGLYKKVFKNIRVDMDLRDPSQNAAFPKQLRGVKLGGRAKGGGKQIIRETLLTRGWGSDDLLKMVETRPGKTESIGGVATPTLTEVRSLLKSEPIDVQVLPITEPLKVRLITKGNALRYWYAGFMQRAMFQQLRKFPQFALIGEPVGIFHLVGLLNREQALGLDFPNWNSGDYSGATDGQDIGSTRHAFETCLWEAGLKNKWTNGEADELRKVIYEQDINYPRDSGLDPVKQQNGQLMGSVLSFPILSAVNLVCYWRALNRYLEARGKPGVERLRDLPVLVNGDDILFRSDPELYGLWKQEIGLSTFTLSPGKNYVHPTILTINSVCFEHKGGSDFVVVPFMNNGLLINRMGTSRDTQKALPIWEHHNMVLFGAMNQIRAHQRFIHYHRKTIKIITRDGKLNLFLPLERGGCGFHVPHGWKLREENYSDGVNPYITDFQRKFATYAKQRVANDLKKGRKPKTMVSLTEKREELGGSIRLPLYHCLEKIPFGPHEESTTLYNPDSLVVKGELLNPFTEIEEDEEPTLKYVLPTWPELKSASSCEMFTSKKIMWYGEKRLVYQNHPTPPVAMNAASEEWLQNNSMQSYEL